MQESAFQELRRATVTLLRAIERAVFSARAERKPATMVELAHVAHFLAVQTMLRPDEATATSELAVSFAPTELRAWLGELEKLSLPQAVQHVRVLIAGNTEAVS